MGDITGGPFHSSTVATAASTGETLSRPLEDGGTLTFLRLIKPMDWHTCVDCYRRPEVLEEREALFHPELSWSEETPP